MTVNRPAPSLERLSFAARAERYARAVLSGEKLAGKWVKAACQRHLDDLARSARDASWPYEFDPVRCGRICHFLEWLPHIKGEWSEPQLRLEDWQVFSFGVPFGWVHRTTRLRRFRRVYQEVARKNAKSTPAAGVALYLTAADGEPGAEVYSLATKKDQAKIVWDLAVQMTQKEPAFRSELGLSSNSKAIYHRSSGSRYEPLGRDSDTKDGFNTHGFVADELHAWKDRALYDVMDSSTGARKQPLGWGITTAGYNLSGICSELRTYLTRILNATLHAHGGLGYRVEGTSLEDDTFFGVIYTLDDGDDWADEAMWIKANPNLGISVEIDDLRSKCARAKASPQAQSEFRTKHCNQWLSASAQWMDLSKWDACADASLAEEQFRGEPCWVGLDAAFKTDVFAKLKLFRRGDHYYAFGRYWLPETQLDVQENAELAAWARQGLITSSPGPVIDIELVRAALAQDRKRHQLQEVPFDPAMLTQFASEMLEQGYPMVEIAPTFRRFSEPMKKLEELVLEGRFHHTGDPVLRWMIANVICVHKGGLIYPTKMKGEERKRKIDGVIALLMALSRAMVATVDNLDEALSAPVSIRYAR